MNAHRRNERRRRQDGERVLVHAARRALLLLLFVSVATVLSRGARTASASPSCNSPFSAGTVDGTCAVPANATSVTITAIGGAGANGFNGGSGNTLGANGDRVQATLAVGSGQAITPGETLYAEVGSNGSSGNGNTSSAGAGGANGGGSSSGGSSRPGGGGGGASDVRTCSVTVCPPPLTSGSDSRLIVAAGGGGGGGEVVGGNGGPASSPGINVDAADGCPMGTAPQGGGGGGSGSGGSAGAGGSGGFCFAAGSNGVSGTLGQGGGGGADAANGGTGGGGGGGYFGGGGGGGAGVGGAGGGGGGGGSDLIPSGGSSAGSGGVAPSVTISFTCTGACFYSTSSTALTSSQNPSTAGQAFTLTATVTCSGFTPTGTINFFDGGNPLGNSLVTAGPGPNQGNGVISPSSLSVGSHSITATYNGDSNCGASTSPLTQTVNQDAAGTALTSSPNPSTAGQTVTFTATVTCGSITPTGTVSFKDGTTQLGSPATLNGSGVAQLMTGSLSVGSHSITAAYSGDTNCAGSTSNTVTQVVNIAGAGTTVTSSVNPSSPGQAVTFTATVTCPNFTPAETVTFTVDGVAGTPVALGGGTASFTTSSLSPGSHSVAAAYSGDTNCAASTSSVLTQSVGTAGGAVTLSSSANPSTQDQAVTFTATVACPGFTPGGTVTFTTDGTAGTPVALSGGTAGFTTSSLTAGSHSVTAAYSGDGNCGASTSAVLTQVVNAPQVVTGPAQPAEVPAVGLAYCYPAPNAPPLGTQCTPFYPNGSPATGPTTALAFCQTYYGTIAQQQACIAATLGNVGGFICPIGCAHPAASAVTPPARLPGTYCALPDGARQWVPQGAPPPAGCG